MSKYFTFLTALLLVLCSSTTSFAQAPKFLILPQQSDGVTGDIVTVDIKVVDFTDIASYQFNLDWNQGLLSYQGVTNLDSLNLIAPPAPVNFGATNVGSGQLVCSWSDPFGLATSLSDSAIIFSVEFELLADAGALEFINFGGTIEVIQNDQFGIPMDVTDINNFTNGPATEAGYGGPGPGPDPCLGATGFTLSIETDTLPTGDQTCLDIVACNFTDIVSMQYTMETNPALLRYDSVTSVISQIANGALFAANNAANGFITFNWIDSTGQGITLPDATVLYSVCYTAVGAGGTEDTLKINSALTPVEITDANSMGSNIGLSSSGGEVVISGTSSSALTVGVSGTSAENGDNVCLDVTVNNFENISGLQFSMNWLPSILTFDQIILPTPLTLTPLNIGVNFNDSQAASGTLTFQWNGTTPGGLDLNNGDVIFQVCFDVVGNAGDVGVVEFTDNPTLREALQEDAMGMTQSINVVTQSGSVNVLGTGGFGLYATHETGEVGETICVDVGAVGFSAITSFQYILEWDTSVVEYVSFNNNILPLQTFVNPGNAPNGRFTFQWLDNSTLGVTYPDSTIIYDFCFLLKGEIGDVSPIRFIGELPTLIEATKDDGTMTGNLITIPLDTVPGSITITSGIDPILVTDTTITNIDCFGDATGAIDIEVMGGTPAYTYNWSNSQTSQDITGVIAGTYTVTITDDTGQTTEESYTITEASQLIGSTVPTGETCDGDADGSIDLTVSGGTGAYTYLWSNSETSEDISGLDDGLYTVTITDANSCTTLATGTVAAGTIVDIQVAKTDETCGGFNNGTIDLTVTGGSGNYNYVWSDASLNGTEDPTGLAAGTYTVTVTEDGNNCNNTATIVIDPGATIGVTTTPNNISCNGFVDGNIEVTVTGGSGNYNYVWSDASLNGTEDPTGLTAGTYTVTVTDNVSGCIIIGTASVSEPTGLTATFAETNPTCNGFTDGAIDITVSGGTPAYTYSWSNSTTSEDLTGIGAGMYTVTVTDASGCTNTFSTQLTEPAALVVTGVVTSETGAMLNDGTITLSISGGTMPYTTIDWDNNTYDGNASPTGLAPGTYNVTVTDDAGCTATNGFVVNAADSPNPQVDLVTQISCNGADDGAITVSVSGGNMPYTYNWSNSANSQNLSGLAPGTYILTVTDATGVTGQSQPVLIEEPPLLTATAVATDVSCSGLTDGSIDVTVSGGTANYTFSWPGGIPAIEDPSGLAQGTYTVTVTDANGCTATATGVVGAPAAIGVSSASVTDASCNGSSDGGVDITPSGGDGNYTFSWSDGSTTSEDLSGVAAGTYTVTITDGNGCSFVSGGFTVADGVAIIISNVDVTNVLCPEVPTGVIDIDVSGGMPNYTYIWTNNNNDTIGTSQDLIGLRGGTYTVEVTDSKGCTQVSNPITVTEPQAINIGLSVTNTTIDNDDGVIDVISASGGTGAFTYSWRGPVGTRTGEPITNLTPGYYYLTATDMNGCVATIDSILVTGIVDAVSDVTDVSCNGGSDGSISITIMGGISPFSYLWDDGTQFKDRTGLSAGTYILTITDAVGTTLVETYVIDEAPPISITNVELTPETGTGCNGGINITVSGGTPPYQYNWSNGPTSQDITDVCKGKYSVEIIDANGCILQSAEYEVLPAALQLASVDPTNVGCNGASDGEVCISTFGGCEPYNFVLSTGETLTSLDGTACFTGLPAGNHTATVTDVFGGTLVVPFTITEPTPIAVNVTVNDNNDPTGTNCNGSIQIDVSGGTQPYTFQWNNGMTSEDISGLCGDLSPYSVTIIDANGCVRVVRDIVLRTISFTVQDVSCFDECDGSIEINIVGGFSPFTYAWDDGSDERLRVNLCAGDYEVSIVNAQGQMITVSTITVNGPSAPLEISAFSQTNPLGTNNDGSIDITVQGGWGAYTYQWTGPNNFSSTVQDPQLLVEGQYSVVITDANGCQITGSYILTGERIETDVTINDVDCNGDDTGSIILSPRGGIPPYSFAWSTGDNDPAIGGLSAGTYTVTITDSGILMAVFEFEILEPPALAATFNTPGNGSATVIVTGGTAPYVYTWNTDNQDTTASVSGQAEGVYTVLIIDDMGCQLAAQVEIEDDLPGFCDRVRNIITPNDDGNNDNFVIDCDQNVTPVLQVFDRWGRLVYQSENYQNDWEGQDAGGNTLPQGGYFYVLEYVNPQTSELTQEKGHLTILR